MSVKERIKEYIRFKNISIREFERLSGLNYGYVNSMRVSIQPAKIKCIALYFTDLNVDWLLTGQGEMLKSTNTPHTNNSDMRIKELELTIIQKDAEIRSLKDTIEMLIQKIKTTI